MKKSSEKTLKVINIGNSNLKKYSRKINLKDNLIIFMRRRYWWRDQSGNLRSGLLFNVIWLPSKGILKETKHKRSPHKIKSFQLMREKTELK